MNERMTAPRATRNNGGLQRNPEMTSTFTYAYSDVI